MNPGSSQFASQFPDAEETMSKMESNKPLCTTEELGRPVVADSAARFQHDARIAHEQREILALCVKALRGHERADVAIAAASRFLEA